MADTKKENIKNELIFNLELDSPVSKPSRETSTAASGPYSDPALMPVVSPTSAAVTAAANNPRGLGNTEPNTTVSTAFQGLRLQPAVVARNLNTIRPHCSTNSPTFGVGLGVPRAVGFFVPIRENTPSPASSVSSVSPTPSV